MKFSCKKNSFIYHLTTVSRAVSTRSAIQALSGIFLIAEDNRLNLSATDMEIGIRVSMGAEIEAAGEVVVPGRLFVDVIRNLPEEEVIVCMKGNEVEVRSGGADFQLSSLPAEDFPSLPNVDNGKFSLPKDEFVETVKRVVRSASRDEARPILTGVYVKVASESLVMVATDSYRLSVKETPLKMSVPEELEVNVPFRAMQELVRIAGEEENGGEILVESKGNQVVFKADEAILSSRLIEGQFPNYKQLMPESFDHELVVSGKNLNDVVKRVGLVAQRNTPLKMSLREGQVTLSAKTADVGEGEESVPVRYRGEGLDVGFNPVFLREGLESAGDGDIKMRLISPLRPGLISCAEDDGFRYLIMPVRLNT